MSQMAPGARCVWRGTGRLVTGAPFAGQWWLAASGGRRRVCAGVRHQQRPVTRNDTVLYFEHANITFEEVQLLSVNASAFTQILQFNQSNITINNLISSGCSTMNQTIYIFNCSGADGKQVTEITNSMFEGGQGRALYIETSNVLLENASFHSLSSNDGGAIQVINIDGSNLSISNCTFINNTAFLVDDDTNDYGYGGALLVRCPYVDIRNSKFSHNSAAVDGGAVYMESKPAPNGTYWPGEYATFDACQFDNNTVGIRGGPLYVSGSNGSNNQTITLKNSQISNHYQDDLGDIFPGANFWGVPFVIIDGCTFMHNSYTYVYGYFTRATSLFLLNSVFLGNVFFYNMTETYSYQGDINNAGEVGGVQAAYCQCVGVYNTTFVNNTGAGLGLRGIQGQCETDAATPGVYPPLFNKNTIAGDEEGSQWIINNVYANTGGVSSDTLTSVSVDIRQSTFDNNIDPSLLRSAQNQSLSQASIGGAGGLNMVDVYKSVLADNVFQNNQGVQGGAVHMEACSITIIWNVEFSNNSASQEGGALASIVNQRTLGTFMGAITARNNRAQSGAAIYAEAGEILTITNSSVLEDNYAATRGGAVHCVNCQLLQAQLDVRLHSNSAGQSGGAIYLDDCDQFMASNMQVINNR